MLTIDDLDVAGRRVLVRADFNVPLEDSGEGTRVITDDGRIRAALPTIESLRSRGARVILVAHLGRPKGEPKPELSLAPIAARLSELIGVRVTLASDVTGSSATAAVAGLHDGEIALLENVRYDPRETSKDPVERGALAAELASFADLFVSDGFGVVHREQASVTDIARLLPHAAGRLVLAEVEVFRKVLSDPDRPYVVVLGGSKVSDKLGVIENLLGSVDRLLIGGGMCFTFLAAMGYEVGDSLLEAEQVETVKGLIASAADRRVELVVPIDLVVATASRRKPTTRSSPRTASSRAGWVWISGRTPGRCSPHIWPMPAPSYGTARWACSRCPPMPRARVPSPSRSPRSRASRWSAAATLPPLYGCSG